MNDRRIVFVSDRRVTPEVEPGYLRPMLPKYAPENSEKWEDIMKDVEEAIMPGITHWQHPRFHAYFPAGNSYPSILGEMLSAGLGIVGFSWAASPACTELETIMLDWIGRRIFVGIYRLNSYSFRSNDRFTCRFSSIRS